MYNKVDTTLNFCDREHEILKLWKQEDVFKLSVKKNQGKTPFTFYDGPPTANGKPHIGHILTRVIKDIIPRYRTMKGYNVLRKAGWDTHGLPVELEVEKSLGMDGKHDIEKYGIEPFIKKCKESVWKYKGEWEKMSDRVGYWADMENPYITYDDNYIESVWWSIKEIDRQGLLYKGHKIVPYCPRCGTALSSHEVAQGYKDVEEKTIYVKFKLLNQPDTYFLAWTTTPWTLPSNVALCMNPKEIYARIKTADGYYILAEALLSSVMGDIPYEIVERRKGKDYEYTAYQPLFDYYKEGEKAFYVTNDNYVTLTDGTGIVHIAPAFGEDDANVGRKYGLPFVQMVNERGLFVEEAYDIKDIFAKDADKSIIKKLKENGLLFKEMLYSHSYPYCWRCDTPLLYYARSSWFIKMTAVKDKLLENNATVNWMPPSIGSGRMGNFLENVIDWGISRERYWGTPLPIWICEKCGKTHVIGSKDELKKLSGNNVDVELHRPYIDEVIIPCACGGSMKRVTEVMDCWYDSGSMPFAQWHYPFENEAIFKDNFPADFISEAVDQTRGWFYTLLAISTLIFGKSSFKNCIVLGHVGDKDGIKMSKHKGNVVDPWSVLDKQGADAVRWYFYTTSAPWLPSRFYDEAVSEAQRKFMGTLWNTYAFFVLYAEIDKYNPRDYDILKCKLSLMDRWILSGLNTLVDYVDKCLSDYKITESARAIQEYTDKLSNWYVRRSRERYWGKEMSKDKQAAYTTLYTVLTTLAKLLAPYTPFMAESIYQNLVKNFDTEAPVSVHLTEYPVADMSYVDALLEKEMDYIIDVVILGRACRNKAAIKNRQPLAAVYVKSAYKPTLQGITSIAAEELNVKEFKSIEEDNELVTYEIKPQLKTLGPKYGSLLSEIRTFLNSCDGKTLVRAVANGGVFNTVIAGREIELTENDLLVNTSSKTGFVADSDGAMTVVLDTNLNEALINEGIVREIVSKIQTMRKEAGFEVTDHIRVGLKCLESTMKIVKDGNVCEDVLCDILNQDIGGGYVKEWDINGEQLTIAIERI